MSDTIQQEPFLTRIPARLDRLPWSRFHWLVVAALGVTWILDGLEVTLKGAVSGVLQQPGVMGFSPAQIGSIASAYLTGAVLGALVFGYMTDRWGRKKLFSITLGVYLLGVLLTALSWNLSSFALFRFLTGAGIGGEYAAINSAIDELIPAKYRGRIDLIVNGSYWIGAALGSGATLIILDPKFFPLFWGWRVGFGIGAVIGLFILLLRKFVPESPRWLMTHGRREEAEAVMRGIEASVEDEHGRALEPAADKGVLIHPGRRFGFGAAAKSILVRYKKRSFLGLSLMISQAFLYNAIFFTYALVLTKFYKVSPEKTGLYLLPFAIGNFLGPLLLGRYFDTVGRRQMISGTYAVSALLLTATGWLFLHHDLSAASQTGLWSVIFFFASAAASSAYLTVSEIFPLEIRAVAIALFFAVGTGAGGIAAPWLFGALIGSGSRGEVFAGYAFASILMLGAAAVAAAWGVKAEGAGLEEIAEPLSAS
ncbi:MAG TPA: MFS transporter [Elusimicrobiota bacterium]|nr:MFS transporter [Elusimicrobiota bacterium]